MEALNSKSFDINLKQQVEESFIEKDFEHEFNMESVG